VEARNAQLTHYVDWPGETHNDRAFKVCSANLKYRDSILVDLKKQSTHRELEGSDICKIFECKNC
jgi:hypothetical protein